MAKPSLSLFLSFFLILFLFNSEQTKVAMADSSCTLSVIGGGCPDVDECQLTCTPCYRGVGKVTSFCRRAEAGLPLPECVCVMSEGASCRPVGPPQCPNQHNPPTPPLASSPIDETLA